LENEKILIIGWDGATYNYINPLIGKGKMPNTQNLIENGAKIDLISTQYCISPSAWASIITGKNPGKHGIFDFYKNEFIDEKIQFRKPISFLDVKSIPFWKYIDKKIKCGVINLPILFPPEKINGLMVTGMMTPKDAKIFSYPSELSDEIMSNIPNYIIEPEGNDFEEENKYKNRDLIIDNIKKSIILRTALFKYLVKRYKDIDLWFIVFVAPDRIGHWFSHFLDKTHPRINLESKADLKRYKNAIDQIYIALDNSLGEILDSVKNIKNIIILSDHGFNSVRKVVLINKWFEKNGYLYLNKKWKKEVAKRNYSILSKADWKKTTLYSLGQKGAIYVNLKGREPQGIVEKEDYENLIVEVRKRMCDEIHDPDSGEKIIRDVLPRDELFWGPYVTKAPDMIVKFKDEHYVPLGHVFNWNNNSIVIKNDDPKIPMPWGTEVMKGICIISGKNIKCCKGIIANTWDIVPTILYILGGNIPEKLDGKVIEKIFKKEFIQKNKIKYYPPLKELTSKLIKNMERDTKL
jgi:predicted AlkP superfamily phosphohydrolase/phosphomutase